MDKLVNKFSSLRYAKELWNKEKKDEIAELEQEHSDIVKDRDRMIDAQVQEIMVRKPTSKVLLPTNVVILSSTFTCNGNLAVHKYTLFIICRC